MINQFDFWDTDVDSRNVKDGLQMFSFAWMKMLMASQITGFINQPYISQERLVQSAKFLTC